MSAQPLNSTIAVFYALRSYRQDLRHTSVQALTQKLHPLVMSIPGSEEHSGVLTRDTSIDFGSAYFGQAKHGAGRGFPIVVGLKDFITFANAQENLSGVDFAIEIGRDKFIRPTSAEVAGDIMGDAGDLVDTNN